MLQFLIKRFAGLIFVLFGVSFITFIMGYLAPGDPITALLGLHNTPAAHALLAHTYGLDVPWYQQYWNFVTHALRGDFGLSFENTGQEVTAVITLSLLVSVQVGLMAFALTLVVGVPVGIIAALRRNTWIDTGSMSVMLLLYSLPSFAAYPPLPTADDFPGESVQSGQSPASYFWLGRWNRVQTDARGHFGGNRHGVFFAPDSHGHA